MGIVERVGRKVRMLREQLGLSQEELGSRVGLGKSQVSRIESGKSNIDIEALDRVASALGVTAAQLADVEPRMVRLVGYVAAKEDSAHVAFEDRLGDEVEVPAELAEDGCSVVRVEGSSMADAGIPDGADLLVCAVELGEYERGDVVIASTPCAGQVVKRYAGQKKGQITLESVGPGETITAPRAEEPGAEGITVQSVVRAVKPARGQWGLLRRPLSSRWR